MRLAHDSKALEMIPEPTGESPWRILISGCIGDQPCGIDGTDYGMGAVAPAFLKNHLVKVFPFCPEDTALGTSRGMPDIHGGDGFAVLEGKARVLYPDGTDVSKEMVAGAKAMVETALDNSVHFALLTDMSAACGTQVISDGCRLNKLRLYRLGVGGAAAALINAGIAVISQRDHLSLARLAKRLDPTLEVPGGLRDHHNHPWVVENLRQP